MPPLTWNADRERLPDGKIQTRFSVRNLNYLAASRSWQAIDTAPRQSGTDLVIDRAPYALTVPALANAACTIEATTRYDIHTRQEMPDAPRGIQKQYTTALPVPGLVTPDGILFSGAWPSLNANRLIQATPNNVRDLVMFTSEPPGNADVQVPFEINGDSLQILESTGPGRPPVELPPQAQPRSIVHGLSFSAGGARGLKIKRPNVWDSAGRRMAITLVGRVNGNNRFIGHKLIPRSFFAGATYPVYCDTTSTFYPDPHTESTSVDGVVLHASVTDLAWATLRGGAGTSATDNGTTFDTAYLMSGVTSATWREIRRGIYLFDTSAITDTDTIDSATMSVYGVSRQSRFSQHTCVVASTPASNTALVSGDYAQLGATKLSDTTIEWGVWSTTGYNDFALNATGLAAISKTGVTKLGTRGTGDQSNTEPSWIIITSGQAGGAGADISGTTQDPKLVVVHSAGAGGTPLRTMMLLGV